MAFILDETLHPDLFPLAFLVGDWQGTGAIQLLGADGGETGRRIEQRLSISHDGSPQLAWFMQTWVLELPAPVPGREDEPVDPGSVVRELLLKERGRFRTSGPLPGQDLARANAAQPGSPESFVSHGVSLEIEGGETWLGEVRGPRLQLAAEEAPHPHRLDATTFATRMFGMIGSRLMWLQEIGEDPHSLRAHFSVELDRA